MPWRSHIQRCLCAKCMRDVEVATRCACPKEVLAAKGCARVKRGLQVFFSTQPGVLPRGSADAAGAASARGHCTVSPLAA
eukprot:9083907-Alexandrium_andersonii.AAC.1